MRIRRREVVVRRTIVALFVWFAMGLVAIAQAKKSPSEKPLDLNQATVEELQQLPEVGPKLAQAIVRFREKSGPFRRVEELLAVPGITKRRLEKIRPFVYVEQVKKSGAQEATK